MRQHLDPETFRGREKQITQESRILDWKAYKKLKVNLRDIYLPCSFRDHFVEGILNDKM